MEFTVNCASCKKQFIVDAKPGQKLKCQCPYCQQYVVVTIPKDKGGEMTSDNSNTGNDKEQDDNRATQKKTSGKAWKIALTAIIVLLFGAVFGYLLVENQAYHHILRTNNTDEVRAYMRSYPIVMPSHSEAASARLTELLSDSVDFKAATSAKACQRYLSRHPQGLHLREVNQLLEKYLIDEQMQREKAEEERMEAEDRAKRLIWTNRFNDIVTDVCFRREQGNFTYPLVLRFKPCNEYGSGEVLLVVENRRVLRYQAQENMTVDIGNGMMTLTYKDKYFEAVYNKSGQIYKLMPDYNTLDYDF